MPGRRALREVLRMRRHRLWRESGENLSGRQLWITIKRKDEET